MRSNSKFLPLLCAVLFSLSLGAHANDQQLILVMYPGRIEWNPVFTYTSTEAQLYTAVYEGLVTYNPRNLQPEPGIAARWTVSEDGLEYRFFIRDNAQYYDGRKITAADVKESWLHMLSLGSASPFAFLLDSIEGARAYRTGRSSDTSQVGLEALRDTELLVRLEAPAPHFLSVLAHQSLVVIHPNFRNNRRWQHADPIPSNGPYLISSRTAQRIEMEKNPRYWDANNVAIQRISIILRDDAVLNTQDYNAGSVDWILGSFDSSELRVPGSFQIGAQFATSYLYFRNAKEAIQDQRVRRALTLLLPLDEIRSDAIYFVPTSRLVPEIEGYPEPESISRSSRTEAFQLLEAAGYTDGANLPNLRVVLTTGEESQRIGELVKAAWEESLGIEVTTEYVDYELLQTIQQSDEYDLSILSWVADYADPLTFLELWKTDNPVNLAAYEDADYENLLNQAARQSGTARFDLLSRAETLLLTGAALVPISHSPSINIVDPSEIGGWHLNPLDIHPFKHLRFDGSRAPSNVASF